MVLQAIAVFGMEGALQAAGTVTGNWRGFRGVQHGRPMP